MRAIFVILAALLLLPLVSPSNYAQSTWNIQTVTSRGAVATFCPIAIDSRNTPHIAYTELKETWGNDHEISFPVYYASLDEKGWNSQAVGFGRADSIVLDKQDNPHLIYVENYKGLMYAKLVGTKWIMEVIDPNVAVYNNGFGTLAIDSENFTHIAFTNGNALFYGVRTQSNNWTIELVFNESTVKLSRAPLTLDSDKNPYLLWYNSKGVQLTHIQNSSFATETIDSNITGIGNIVLDSNGYPNIVYTKNFENNSAVVYAIWTGSVWEKQTVYSTTKTTYDSVSTLTLDSYNYPHVSYVVDAGKLAYARWTGINWDIQTVDSDLGWLGGFSYLALDSNGNLHISYCGINYPAGDIRYATSEALTPIYTPPTLSSSTPSTSAFPDQNLLLLVVIIIVLTFAIVTLLIVFKGHRKNVKLKEL
ncbi:MAG: hypothetical protein ACFCUE_03640 [Candidatus Bathyarchaeia archaeon]